MGLPVVYTAVDTTEPNLHIGYHTLNCISVAHGIHADSRFLLMPNVNGMQRLYISFITLLIIDRITLFVASIFVLYDSVARNPQTVVLSRNS